MILAEFTSTAKINLFLDIKGKDPADGYHFIESIFVEIPWGDDFIISEASEDQINFTGLGAEDIPWDNTVRKTLSLFKQKFEIKETLRIDIWKNIPAGAGLGGGSGDAGALLRFLCARHRKKLASVVDIASAVGSDVNFFLTGGSAHVSGKGDRVKPLLGRPEQSLGTLIVCPRVHCSTKEGYETLGGNFNYNNGNRLKQFEKKNAWGLDFLKENSYNIFEKILVCPEGKLEGICQTVKQAAKPPFMLISGSGSSFVLFYSSPQDATQAETHINDLNCGIYTQQIWW